jgi:Zn-finger nucleic acid-binding protein
MTCPHCDVNLLMTERQGVEIDYCPECRGVWLDRGELDKILERSHAEVAAVAPMAAPAPVAAPTPPRESARVDDRHRSDDRYRSDDRHPSDDRYRSDDRRGYEEPAYKKKKRKSFIEDIFDF